MVSDEARTVRLMRGTPPGFIRWRRIASGLVGARPRPLELHAAIFGRRVAKRRMTIALELELARSEAEQVLDATLHCNLLESMIGHPAHGSGLPMAIGSCASLCDIFKRRCEIRQIRDRNVIVRAEIGRKIDLDRMRKRRDRGHIFAVVIGAQRAGLAPPMGPMMLDTRCNVTRRELRGRRLR